MRVRFVGLLVGALALVPLGCASTPKPKEIVALEQMRADPTLSDPDRRAFDLLAAADALLVQASRAWESHDMYAARRDALMGQIKMKTALALLQQERLTERNSELDAELSISREEASRLESELGTAREEVALLGRLRVAKQATAAERKALSAQADSVRKQAANDKRRSEATNALRVLELTLKIAETVEAPHYAKASYTAAKGMMQDAHKELDAGHWDDALARVTLAQAEGEKAIAISRPLYERAAHALSNQARDRALEADATAIAGLETRLVRQGDLQRLVLIFPGLFADKSAALRPEQSKAIDAVKDLLNKYPTYPLQVTGFADAPAKAGQAAEVAALSLARANAVYWALVSRGIDPKRLSVDTKSSAGPTPDARVELSILYHGAEGARQISASH